MTTSIDIGYIGVPPKINTQLVVGATLTNDTPIKVKDTE